MNTHTEEQVNIYDAKIGLSRLVSRAEQGEQIVISRNGPAVARLVPYAQDRKARLPGVWSGQVVIHPDFDDVTDEDQRDWYGE